MVADEIPSSGHEQQSEERSGGGGAQPPYPTRLVLAAQHVVGKVAGQQQLNDDE